MQAPARMPTDTRARRWRFSRGRRRTLPADPIDTPLTGASSSLRHPERPILMACASVGLLFALLAVLERMGVGRTVLGMLAVTLPLAAVLVLALLGRTIERLPFVVDGARGSALGNGLALGAEWMGVWLVPAAVLVPAATGSSAAAAAPLVLGSAAGLALLALALAGPMRRARALSAPAFLLRRTGRPGLGLLTMLPSALAIIGLGVFQLVLLRALLAPFVGAATDMTLLLLVSLASLVCIVGGQRSLTLVNAFLAFFLALAMVVPALSALAGIEGLTAALPLDRAFAAALPGALVDQATAASVAGQMLQFFALALATLALPTFAARLSAVHPGGPSQAGAWTMLAGYVVFTAASIAFTRTVLAPGLTITAHGETSILSVLPALGWLGALWAGFAASLFALAATIGQDLRWRRAGPARGWMDTGGLVVMRLVFIAAPVGLWLVWAETTALDRLDGEAARLAIAATVIASAGVLAPALVAAAYWRPVTGLALAAGQVAAVAIAYALWTILDAATLALVAAGVNTIVIIVAGRLTPRRWRPDPARLAAFRDP